MKYLIFVSIFILTVGLLLKEEYFTINIYDTYFITSYIYIALFSEGLVLAVMPGTFTITAGGISKSWKNLKPIKVERGDSLVVKVFLEDDTEPLLD